MRNYTYVVVEDEDLLRSSLIKKIENLHLPLKLLGTADNGMDALELVRQVYPDLILLDIMMPVMDGMELAEKVHEQYPEIKMVIVTGYSDFELARKAIRFGVVEYLLKPIDLQELQQTLNRLLQLLQADRERRDKVERRKFVYGQIRASKDRKNSSKAETVDLIEQFLKENFREEISLGDLAEQAGFTLDYLSRIFKKYKKESPRKFLIRLRIEEAKRILLEQPDLGIREVGELVGYPDPYYFSRLFKEQTSIYPSEYRKSIGEYNTSLSGKTDALQEECGHCE